MKQLNHLLAEDVFHETLHRSGTTGFRLDHSSGSPTPHHSSVRPRTGCLCRAQTRLGELATSVAHEINQPLGAIVNNSNACVKLFDKHGSNDEIREALSDIIRDALRAGSVIARTRELVRKSPPKKGPYWR
jgi:signal transduction histidine kinase